MPGRKVNPIPELVKGSKTPYRQWTRYTAPVTPFERRASFEDLLRQAYPPGTRVRSWYALGSGRHWVGVVVFMPFANSPGPDVFWVTVALFSGKSWSVAENKTRRWISMPEAAVQTETGAGSPAFLLWVASELKEYMTIRQMMAERGYPSELAINWADETRRRAYRWLLRLGFREEKDVLGDPAYIRRFTGQAALAARRNPIKVELDETGRELDETGRDPTAGAHERLMWSKKAAEIIERKGTKIRHNIKYVVTQDPLMPLADHRGEPGVLTLYTDPGFTQTAADSWAAAAVVRREFKVSPYTIHTILHRLGDEIMPDLATRDGCWPPPMLVGRFIQKNIAVPVRLEQVWDTLYRAVQKIKNALYPSGLGLSSWLPLSVDTKACREGWIKHSGQALAELVPMHLLYSGIRFLPTPARRVPDAAQRARIDAAATAAIPAFGAYIDGMIQMLQGCRIRI